MDLKNLTNLQTELIVNDKDVNEAYRLGRLYCYLPITRKGIKDTLLADYWSMGELLTDMVLNPKTGTWLRQYVAFVLFAEARNAQNEKRMLVTCFAHTPWYDTEVAARWADYRVSKALEEHKELSRTIWLVDENNVDLQIALRELGYKADGHIDLEIKDDYKKVIFIK